MEPSYDADVRVSWQKKSLKVFTSWLQEIMNRNFSEYARIIVSLGSLSKDDGYGYGYGNDTKKEYYYTSDSL